MQETETSNGTFYLYGAYLDRRKNNRLGPTIRILGMINRLEPRVRTFCQIWFQGSHQPVISKVLEYKYIWFKKWGNYKHGIFQPYMLACQGWMTDLYLVSYFFDIQCTMRQNEL